MAEQGRSRAGLSLGQSTVLRLSVVWTVWVWAVLIRNMITDHTHGIAFRAVHIGLAVVSIAFGVATWVIVRRARRRARPGDELRTAEG